MLWAIFVVVSLAPAVVASAIGLAMHFMLRSKAPALQAGVWSFAIAAGVYAAWQVWLFINEGRSSPAYVTGSVVIIAIPAFACAIGLLAFLLVWGGAAVVVEWRRVAAGRTTVLPAVARAIVPAVLMLATGAYAVFLARPSSYERAQKAANDPAAVAALFREGMERNDASLLQDVGSLPTLPAEMVAQLAAHPNVSVRWKIATRADLPPDLLGRLGGDADEYVRAAVARNEAASDETLRAIITAGGTRAPRGAQEALDRRVATTRPAV